MKSQRSKAVLFASGLLFLLAAWFLFLAYLSWAGRTGDASELAMIPAARLRQFEIAGALSNVLSAGIVIVAGLGLFFGKGWSRFLGLVFGFWVGIAGIAALLDGASPLRGAVFLIAAFLLIGMLLSGPVKGALTAGEPRPTGVTVLGVLYFIQVLLVLAVSTPILVSTPFFGFLIVVAWVAVPMLVGVGLLELHRWARKWTLVVSWLTLALVALGWIRILAGGADADAVGTYFAQNLLVVPLSVFTLWYLNRLLVKERFLKVE